MSWTQEELEELYQKINKALAEDPAFREKMRKDARAAAEELAGRPLEEGFRLNYIEQDAGYGDTYVLPDFVGEELDSRELGVIAGGKNVKSVSGGDCQKDSVNSVSVLTVVSACPAASAACSIDFCPQEGSGCPSYCGAYACVTEAPPPCTDYTGPCGADAPPSDGGFGA
ncbi:MAG: hypothetical protein IKF55_05920 [Oscillospiraceae bacterium]|nr:hypothetical protein [Oscillospiraceae bacterium]